MTILATTLLLLTACGDDDGSGPARTDSGRATSDAGSTPRSDAGTGGVDAGDSDAGAVAALDAGSDSGAMMASGACTNAADDAIFMSADVVGAAGDCAGGCFGGEACVTDCVVMRVSLSRPCAACFGAVSQCTVNMCALQCLGGGDSPSCSSCRDAMGCTAAFNTCTGRT